MFVSPPPGVDWPQVADPTAQTSARVEDVDWAVLGVGEEAMARATSKWPVASKRRQAIFNLSDDETEDADILRLVPRKRRRQLESTEKGGSSVPVEHASPTTAMRRTSDIGVKHQAPAPVLVVERDPVASTEHLEQTWMKRRTFATSFRASKL